MHGTYINIIKDYFLVVNWYKNLEFVFPLFLTFDCHFQI